VYLRPNPPPAGPADGLSFKYYLARLYPNRHR
jgi:hypothetical protein